MKVGIITFHASHNYGSMLQAYALQQTVISLGHECEIINLRTPIQANIFKPFYKQNGWLKKLKAIRYPFLAIHDRHKHILFENFLEQNYILSANTYTSTAELRQANLKYDCYISGSDQIWNTSCADFSSAYYLDFVKKGIRVAYAPSMGPTPDQVKESFNRFISECLSRYNFISVREPGTGEKVKQITGKNVNITADPTLLLSQSQWFSMAKEEPIFKGDYLLLYTPWYFNYKELYAEAARLAEKKKMQVICTLPEGYRYWHKNPLFKYYTAVGPIEFLNLIKYSKSVLCGSFHAVVFSLIFGKSFYAYKGMDDSRISHLLKLTGLKQCAESPKSIDILDFTNAYEKLKPFIESSRQFLKNSLK